MFNVLGMLLSGLIIGALARLLYPGNQALGYLATIGLGIIGSFAGGLLMQLARKPSGDIKLNRAGLLMSILGSILVLFIARRLNLW